MVCLLFFEGRGPSEMVSIAQAQRPSPDKVSHAFVLSLPLLQ